jgi:muramoyltetrapeptide carboxypeptidase
MQAVPNAVALRRGLHPQAAKEYMNTLKPKRLRKGDTIGLVTPASPVADSARIERGVRYLETLGYRVEVGKNVGRVHGYLAGTDDERLDDLHGFFADKRIAAIIALRGGYGTPRLLDRLDYRMIGRHPKILAGFSDITGLQLAIWKRCGLVTFHGPMAAVEMTDAIDPFTEEMFWGVVSTAKKFGRVAFADSDRIATLSPGRGEGTLIGGNLSLFVSMLGTRYAPSLAASVLFLEEIAEEPYRVDRMLTQLRNAGAFTKSRAILTGQFVDCVPSNPSKPSLSVDDVLADCARQAEQPFLSNLPFGHVPHKMTLPVGIHVRVDTRVPSVDFLESAVD